MQISKNKVATFDFTVTDDNGVVLDTSERVGPFSYVHGIGYLVPGLEAQMEGKSVGDRFAVSVPPAEGYGEWDEALLQEFPLSAFEGIDNLEVGMHLQTQGPNGTGVVRVTTIEADKVTVDGNHPLCGVTLNFNVSVVDVRDATQEELEHGHIHDECCSDGCQDDCQGECDC